MTPLLDIIELNAVDCSAEALWEQFTNRMAELGVPLSNMLGIAVDHAPVMVGIHNSFASRFLKACPWGVILDCICHSSHLAASAAC